VKQQALHPLGSLQRSKRPQAYASHLVQHCQLVFGGHGRYCLVPLHRLYVRLASGVHQAQVGQQLGGQRRRRLQLKSLQGGPGGDGEQ
jgi:hypothetical protein